MTQGLTGAQVPAALIPEQRHWLEDLHGQMLHEAAAHEALAVAAECRDREAELYDAEVYRARAGYLAKQLGWTA